MGHVNTATPVETGLRSNKADNRAQKANDDDIETFNRLLEDDTDLAEKHDVAHQSPSSEAEANANQPLSASQLLHAMLALLQRGNIGDQATMQKLQQLLRQLSQQVQMGQLNADDMNQLPKLSMLMKQLPANSVLLQQFELLLDKMPTQVVATNPLGLTVPQTRGDTILNNVASQVDRTQIQEAFQTLVKRLDITSAARREEVRVLLKPTVLKGVEIQFSTSNHGKTIDVKFANMSAQQAALIEQLSLEGLLQDHLRAEFPEQIIRVSAERADEGHSGQQRDHGEEGSGRQPSAFEDMLEEDR